MALSPSQVKGTVCRYRAVGPREDWWSWRNADVITKVLRSGDRGVVPRVSPARKSFPCCVKSNELVHDVEKAECEDS